MVPTVLAPVLLHGASTRGAGGFVPDRPGPARGRLMPEAGREQAFPFPGLTGTLSILAPRVARPILTVCHFPRRARRTGYLVARSLKGRKGSTSKLIHALPTIGPVMDISDPKASPWNTALWTTDPATPLNNTASMKLRLRSPA